MKAERFPLTVTEKGVSAIIRKSTKLKGETTHTYFIVEYIHLGKRKQVWRSSLGDAKSVAREACIKVGNGEQTSLEMVERDRLAYTRAVDILSPTALNRFRTIMDTMTVGMSRNGLPNWTGLPQHLK